MNMTTNGNAIRIPSWLIQTIVGLMLVSTLTGVIALNVRFSRVEEKNAVQDQQISDIKDNYAKKSWAQERFEPIKK